MGKLSRCAELAREKRIVERKLKLLMKEFTELESENLMIKDQVDLGNFEFQKAMEVFRVHYDGLCMKFEVKEMDFQDLLFRKSVVEGQLKACKITIDGLIQRIAFLECGKDGSRAQQGDGKEKVGGFMTENGDLELGTQSGWRMKRGFELKKELGVYRTRCEELSAKLENKKMGFVLIEGKYKELMSRNVVLDEKLGKFKNVCSEMHQRIRRLEEERKAKCENDKRVQVKIGYLEKELKKKEINEKLKYAELIAVNRNLESGKARAENEIKVLMKKLEDLEKGELNKELEAYRSKFHELSVELEEKKMEGGLNEAKLKELMLEKSVVDDELKACKRTCDGLKDLISGLEEDQFEREKRAQERITFMEVEMKKLGSVEGENYFELIMQTKGLECAKRSAEDETEIWKKRFRELETRASRMEQVELEKAELEKEVEILLTKCDELSKDLEEKKIERVGVEYKRMCHELKEQNMGLEAVLKFISEKEKRAQERSTNLGEDIKKMESDESEKYVKLKIENWDLGCQKRRAEEEVEIWKKRFKELETTVLRLEEEISTLRSVDSQVSGALPSEVSYNGKREKYKRNIKLQSETKSRTDGAHVDHLKMKEKKMLNNSEKILTSSFAGCNHFSSLQGNVDGHITGPASIIMQSSPLVNVKEEQNSTNLQSKVECGSSVRLASGGNVGINDCEDKKSTTLKHTCNFRGEEMLYVSTDNTPKRSLDNEKDLQSRKRLKRQCSDLKAEENSSSCEDDILLFSGVKRNASKIVTSGSESEDDDRIPIGKLEMKKPKKLNEGVHKLSHLNLSGGYFNVSSRGQSVEESISLSKQKLISLIHCKEENSCGQKTSQNENASPNRSQMSGTSYRNAGNPTSDNGKENVAKDIVSHSEAERSLGGFVEKWSDSSDSGDSDSDSEDTTDIALSFNQVIAMLQRNGKRSPL